MSFGLLRGDRVFDRVGDVYFNDVSVDDGPDRALGKITDFYGVPPVFELYFDRSGHFNSTRLSRESGISLGQPGR